MQSSLKLLATLLLSSTVLIGCGGGDPPILERNDTGSSGGTGGTGGGGSGGGGSSASGITYVPLSVLEGSDDFAGDGNGGLFQGYGQSPLIDVYLINPVDAATLQSVSNATVSNYQVTVDGTAIDSSESFPVFQKVAGNITFLRTALVFDLSNSTSQVDIDALVAEAKAYITAAKASADFAVSTQEYVVWIFGSDVEELTSGFTSDTTEINAALDAVASRFGDPALIASSNVHRAVVEAIGRFQGEVNSVSYDFRDADGTATPNDLVDIVTPDGILLSQLVVFSSGPDTALAFNEAKMIEAIQSQSLLQYDTASSTGEMRNLYKPVFYYVVGRSTNGVAYVPLSAASEATRNIRLNNGSYSFASDLVANQIAAIDARVDRDNQYIYRYAFLPRVGDHETLFSSNSVGRAYTLRTQYKHDDINGVGDVAPVVEITGANGEYISNQVIKLSEMATFAPATRWDDQSYAATDYTWSLVGGTGTSNADGTFTVNSISGAGATLSLTNTELGSDAEDITIIND